MRKCKQKSGFTLVEMLACVITLLLMAGICGMGTDLAMRSYNYSTFESDSQMLESTVDLYIMDMLRHAYNPQTGAQNIDNPNLKQVVSFSNRSYGMLNGNLVLQDQEGEARFGRFLIYKNPEDMVGSIILSESTYTNTIYVADFELWYNETEQYFTGSYTIKSTILEDASRVCEFTCRTIAVYE